MGNKKKSNTEEPQQQTISPLERQKLRFSKLASDHNDSRTTKYWLTDSRRCHAKQNRYPQLVELPVAKSPDYYPPWNRRLPRRMNIRVILELGSPRSYYIASEGIMSRKLILTGISNSAFMVYTSLDYSHVPNSCMEKKKVVTHKSTELDPYDANKGVMKFSHVLGTKDGKYYAVSSQGAFVVMEQVYDERIIVTRICATRAIPSSTRAKLFQEYLFESEGEILLVFLIYKESVSKLADEIEAFRFDVDTFKLVNVLSE